METTQDRKAWIRGGSAQCEPPKPNEFPRRLVLLGAPGVGKGTQAETRVLTCEAFANNTRDFEPAQPWVGTKEPPLAEAITPVIALGG